MREGERWGRDGSENQELASQGLSAGSREGGGIDGLGMG